MHSVIAFILLLTITHSSTSNSFAFMSRMHKSWRRVFVWGRYVYHTRMTTSEVHRPVQCELEGRSTYEDFLSNVYDKHDNCATRTYTMLDQCDISIWLTSCKKMECERIDKNKFNCTSTVESAWVRIWDTSYYKEIIENCGMKWHEQYQDVM